MTKPTRRKPKLKDITRLNPSMAHWREIVERAATLSDTETATFSASLVEMALEQLLALKFPNASEKSWACLVEADGPLASFSRKISAGRAFGFYDDAFQQNLIVAKGIRNAFAHARRMISFEDDLVHTELLRIKVPIGCKGKPLEAFGEILAPGVPRKESYVRLCCIMAAELSDTSIMHMKLWETLFARMKMVIEGRKSVSERDWLRKFDKMLLRLPGSPYGDFSLHISEESGISLG